MTPSTTLHQLSSSSDPYEVARALSGISEALLASYTRLAAKADRVDRELLATNAELSAKIAELDAILQALPSGVIVRDDLGQIVRSNASAGAILGVDPRSLIGRKSHPGLAGAAARGESLHFERAPGDWRVLASRGSVIADVKGTVRGSVEILDDRTDTERLVEKLHTLDKMAALGNMAGGIAHEIRNPMNAVRGFAELLRREFDSSTKAHRFASRICDGCDEANQIITSLLMLASPERLSLEDVDSTALVDEAIATAMSAIPSDAPSACWDVTRSVEVTTLRGDRIKLRQALRNLVANALQAQPTGGRVHVEVARHGAVIRVRVADAGPGVPERLAHRISEPFFTTRPEGTGLGLALVRTIVELHGGELQISTTPSELGGAEIAFTLPSSPK